MSNPFLGEIRLVPYNFAPRGWAFCSGQLLPISQNTALFALLGTTYGGDGRTTFALPDLRGRVAVSSGQGPGLSNYDLGSASGEESHVLSVIELPPHTHAATAQVVTGAGNSPSPAGNIWAASTARDNQYSNAAPNGALGAGAIAVANAGSGSPHNNLPPYLVLNYIIALEGIFPSRN